MMKNRYQNLTESALPDNSRGIVIFKKLFVSIKFSSPPFDVMFIALHDVQLHGWLSLFSNFDRSLSAGPSFIPKILIKCSSVSIIKPSPSMLCSRKFCKWKEKYIKKINSNANWLIATCPQGLYHESSINFFSQPSFLLLLLLHS